jgi:transcriptional regulator with XRE-family HTH domain
MEKTKIQIQREEQKISRAELSRISGVPLRTLEELEARRNKDPRTSTMASIASALRCTIESLIG